MKFCTFLNQEQRQCVGLVKGDRIIELSSYKDMIELIQNYDADKIQSELEQAKNEYAFEDVKFMAPVTKPAKMIFVGLNYRDHARETNSPIPEHLIFFPKYSNSLIGHNENVIIPKETEKCDYEAEFAFVIGKTAKNISIEDAMKFVLVIQYAMT